MYSLSDIATAYGYSVRTLNNRIKKFREEGKFTKTSLGRFYEHADAVELSKLLPFNLNALERNKTQRKAS